MVSPIVRKPAVAGQFYPRPRQALEKQIAGLVEEKTEKIDAIACILPHAGYIYSGRVAGQTVSSIKIKDSIILLGPNHTGYGRNYSIMTEGSWETPLGQIRVDSPLAKEILAGSELLKEDPLAHVYEHSLEVELPFLQYFKPDFKIVPITFMSDNIEELKQIGTAVAHSLENRKENSLIVASSDMTHYESQTEAEFKDKEAIDAILQLDTDTLIKKIRDLNISMCGWAPVVVMLQAAKLLGAKNATLVKYETSGAATGDTESVVGYAGVIIY